MAERKVVATWDENGEVHIEGFGFSGRACLDAMQPYEAAIGLGDAEKMAKPEMTGVKAKAGGEKAPVTA
jgi:hypothetical protein